MPADRLHPDQAWAQTALALRQSGETFEKLGVRLGASELDFSKENEWKATP